MKILLFLLLPLFGMGQTVRSYSENHGNIFVELWWPGKGTDTVGYFEAIPATVLVQYSYHDAITVRDVYLINGEPWYRSKAPLTRGKWIKPNWYRWQISNNWITNKMR